MKKRILKILVLLLVLILSLTSCEDLIGQIQSIFSPEKQLHTLRFELNGADTEWADIQVNHEKCATEPAAPTKFGYTFQGWYSDAELSYPWSFSTPITEDTVIYAKWKKNDTTPTPEPVVYEVSFSGADITTQNVEEGKTATAPDEPAKEGHSFDGWFIDAECTLPFDFTTPITASITLYAKWTPIKGDDELKTTNVYIVGDSTAAEFSDDYYYPRYGFGTQLSNYLDEAATVYNLALSGRSSKSFLAESEYEALKNGLKEGDYLIIAFGHNDQKSDDASRFTDATMPYTDPASFGYHLYEYYIKLAREKGATPILMTPIVRAASDDDYTGSEGHVTATGNYRQAIIELGAAVEVSVIDMTGITAAEYQRIGFDNACKYHAVIAGKYDTDGTTVVPNMATVDKTHLNIYGAKAVAFWLAGELKKLDGIGRYVLADITAPTEADRKPLEGYVVPDYAAPDLSNYAPADHFSATTEGWYGTAFGNTGGNPQSYSSNGYIAKEVSTGVFQVGQHLESGSNKGKFENASDGFAFMFRQVDASKNFKLTVSGKVLYTGATKQAGFGLMLRDDCIIDQTANGTINTNYITAGILADSATEMSVNFYRENASLKKGEKKISGLWAVDDTLTMTIERIGQTVNVTVVYGGVTYSNSYYDFDLTARDTEYMYIGMFANRGTVVEFSNVEFTITGDSLGA